MSKRSILWVRSNWAEISGIPLPDSGAWALRDIPISLAALRGAKERGLVTLTTPSPVPVEGSATKKESQQKLWETPPAVFEYVARDSVSVARETVEAFACRPEADLYVVDVFDDASKSIASTFAWIASELDLDVQIVGVAPAEPENYPGEAFVEVDDWEVTATEFRAIPAADLVSVSTGLDRAWDAPAIVEQSGATRYLVNASAAMIVDAVEGFVLGGDEYAGRRFTARKERPSDPDQTQLANWDPGVVVQGEVEFGEGQTSLTELNGKEVRADCGEPQ